MCRKLTLVFISILLIFCLSVSASSQTLPYVTDEAGLLLPEEITVLENKANDLYSRYGIHAAILTINSLDGIRPQDFADDYYDETGYGDDGVLFLLAMTEREWYISTSGNLIYALTDYGIQQIGESILPFLAGGMWYDGFYCYLDSLPAYLDALEMGIPIDGYADDSGDYYHADQEETIYYEEESAPSFLFSFICGLVVSGVVILIMRMCMVTKRPQRSAGEYIIDGSWKLIQHHDIFLYSNVTKTKKQDPPKNSGGSSVHRSSSGRRHGGGGGKF